MSRFLPWNCCKPADAYGYDFEQGPAEQAHMPPRAELDLEACQPKEKPVFGRGEEKVDDQVKEERQDARLIEHDAVAQAQVIECPHLCEQTCDCCKANHEARQSNLEAAGLIPSTATSYTSCFPSCFSSSSAPAPAKAEGETTGGWSMGNIMGNTQTAEQDPGVWNYRSKPLDKMKAASFFRAVDMSDVTTNMEVFRTVSRVPAKEVADRLMDEGCSARIAEMFVEKEICGDTLHTLHVEDLIRDWGLERYVAEGLYNKIRRILGTTIGGELVQIHGVDSQPTSKSLVRLVRQQHEHRYSGNNYLGMALGGEETFSGTADRKAGERQETTADRDREGSQDAGRDTPTLGVDEVKTSDENEKASCGGGWFSCAATAPGTGYEDDIDANPRMGEETPSQQTMTPMTPTQQMQSQQMQHMQNQTMLMHRNSTMQGGMFGMQGGMGTMGMQQQWPMQAMNHQGGGMNNISQQATQQMGQPSQMPEKVTLRVESVGSETPAGPNNQL